MILEANFSGKSIITTRIFPSNQDSISILFEIPQKFISKSRSTIEAIYHIAVSISRNPVKKIFADRRCRWLPLRRRPKLNNSIGRDLISRGLNQVRVVDTCNCFASEQGNCIGYRFLLGTAPRGDSWRRAR